MTRRHAAANCAAEEQRVGLAPGTLTPAEERRRVVTAREFNLCAGMCPDCERDGFDLSEAPLSTIATKYVGNGSSIAILDRCRNCGAYWSSVIRSGSDTINPKAVTAAEMTQWKVPE